MKNNNIKVSKKVSIEVNQSKILHKEFIPKEIPFKEDKKIMEQMGISLHNRIPILLVGETGTGKTSLVRHLAHRTNNAFVRVNHNGGTTVEDIIGRYVLDKDGMKWVDGILITAMKNGYWYLADEINAASADINFAYHQLLDDDAKVIVVEKGDEVIIPHPNFRFFASMNPSSDYAGTKELNKALLSRFSVVKIDYQSPKDEQEILVVRTGIDKKVAESMVRFAAEIRILQSKQETTFVLSTRDIIMWAQMYKFYGKYIPSAETSVLNKVVEDESEAIKDMLAIHFKALDEGTVPVSTVGGGVEAEDSAVSPF
jgi:cobaltochelatase CobS